MKVASSFINFMVCFQTTPAIVNAARENVFALKASSYIQDSYVKYKFGYTIFFLSDVNHQCETSVNE